MNYTHIVGIDPGYGTQGIAIIDCRRATPEPVVMEATLALKKEWDEYHLSIEDRIKTQLKVIWIAASVCDRFKTLVVIEEWRTSSKNPNNITSYWRGYYDCMLRTMMASNFGVVVTVSPICVSQFSNPLGKFTSNKESPDALGILTYLESSCQHWMPNFRAQTWLERKGVNYLLANGGSKPTKSKKHRIHYADAMVMAVMGYIAGVNPGLGHGRPPHQQDIIEKLRETLKAARENDTR